MLMELHFIMVVKIYYINGKVLFLCRFIILLYNNP